MADTFFAGLDLGQQNDRTALVVLQRTFPGDRGALRVRPRPEPHYRVGHIERFETGIPYTDMVGQVEAAITRDPLKRRTTLVVDATGVGRAVADLFTHIGRSAQSVTITGGHNANRSGSEWTVPKQLLASTVQSLLQTGRLQFSERVPHTDILKQEMKDFRVKVSDSGHARFEHREGKHDDLVLATALAAWYAERHARRRRAWETVTTMN
jgi:hypothetical protein